jgi:hypothetical protein
LDTTADPSSSNAISVDRDSGMLSQFDLEVDDNPMPLVMPLPVHVKVSRATTELRQPGFPRNLMDVPSAISPRRSSSTIPAVIAISAAHAKPGDRDHAPARCLGSSFSSKCEHFSLPPVGAEDCTRISAVVCGSCGTPDGLPLDDNFELIPVPEFPCPWIHVDLGFGSTTMLRRGVPPPFQPPLWPLLVRGYPCNKDRARLFLDVSAKRVSLRALRPRRVASAARASGLTGGTPPAAVTDSFTTTSLVPSRCELSHLVSPVSPSIFTSASSSSRLSGPGTGPVPSVPSWFNTFEFPPRKDQDPDSNKAQPAEESKTSSRKEPSQSDSKSPVETHLPQCSSVTTN